MSYWLGTSGYGMAVEIANLQFNGVDPTGTYWNSGDVVTVHTDGFIWQDPDPVHSGEWYPVIVGWSTGPADCIWYGIPDDNTGIPFSSDIVTNIPGVLDSSTPFLGSIYDWMGCATGIALWSGGVPGYPGFVDLVDININISPIFLTIDTPSNGTTNPAPGMYAEGVSTAVFISVVPNSGYVFDSIQYDAGVPISNTTIIMDIAHVADVNFISGEYVNVTLFDTGVILNGEGGPPYIWTNTLISGGLLELVNNSWYADVVYIITNNGNVTVVPSPGVTAGPDWASHAYYTPVAAGPIEIDVYNADYPYISYNALIFTERVLAIASTFFPVPSYTIGTSGIGPFVGIENLLINGADPTIVQTVSNAVIIHIDGYFQQPLGGPLNPWQIAIGWAPAVYILSGDYPLSGFAVDTYVTGAIVIFSTDIAATIPNVISGYQLIGRLYNAIDDAAVYYDWKHGINQVGGNNLLYISISGYDPPLLPPEIPSQMAETCTYKVYINGFLTEPEGIHIVDDTHDPPGQCTLTYPTMLTGISGGQLVVIYRNNEIIWRGYVQTLSYTTGTQPELKIVCLDPRVLLQQHISPQCWLWGDPGEIIKMLTWDFMPLPSWGQSDQDPGNYVEAYGDYINTLSNQAYTNELMKMVDIDYSTFGKLGSQLTSGTKVLKTTAALETFGNTSIQPIIGVGFVCASSEYFVNYKIIGMSGNLWNVDWINRSYTSQNITFRVIAPLNMWDGGLLPEDTFMGGFGVYLNYNSGDVSGVHTICVIDYNSGVVAKTSGPGTVQIQAINWGDGHGGFTIVGVGLSGDEYAYTSFTSAEAYVSHHIDVMGSWEGPFWGPPTEYWIDCWLNKGGYDYWNFNTRIQTGSKNMSWVVLTSPVSGDPEVINYIDIYGVPKVGHEFDITTVNNNAEYARLNVFNSPIQSLAGGVETVGAAITSNVQVGEIQVYTIPKSLTPIIQYDSSRIEMLGYPYILQCNWDEKLKAMNGIKNTLGWYLWVDPTTGQLCFSSGRGSDLTATIEYRDGVNCILTNYEVDTFDRVDNVYVIGKGTGNDQLLGWWPPVLVSGGQDKVDTLQNVVTLEMLSDYAHAEWNDLHNPVTRATITVLDDSLKNVEVGDIVKVRSVPDENGNYVISGNFTILGVDRQYDKNGEQVKLQLYNKKIMFVDKIGDMNNTIFNTTLAQGAPQTLAFSANGNIWGDLAQITPMSHFMTIGESGGAHIYGNVSVVEKWCIDSTGSWLNSTIETQSKQVTFYCSGAFNPGPGGWGPVFWVVIGWDSNECICNQIWGLSGNSWFIDGCPIWTPGTVNVHSSHIYGAIAEQYHSAASWNWFTHANVASGGGISILEDFVFSSGVPQFEEVIMRARIPGWWNSVVHANLDLYVTNLDQATISGVLVTTADTVNTDATIPTTTTTYSAQIAPVVSMALNSDAAGGIVGTAEVIDAAASHYVNIVLTRLDVTSTEVAVYANDTRLFTGAALGWTDKTINFSDPRDCTSSVVMLETWDVATSTLYSASLFLEVYSVNPHTHLVQEPSGGSGHIHSFDPTAIASGYSINMIIHEYGSYDNPMTGSADVTTTVGLNPNEVFPYDMPQYFSPGKSYLIEFVTGADNEQYNISVTLTIEGYGTQPGAAVIGSS